MNGVAQCAASLSNTSLPFDQTQLAPGSSVPGRSPVPHRVRQGSGRPQCAAFQCCAQHVNTRLRRGLRLGRVHRKSRFRSKAIGSSRAIPAGVMGTVTIRPLTHGPVHLSSPESVGQTQSSTSVKCWRRRPRHVSHDDILASSNARQSQLLASTDLLFKPRMTNNAANPSPISIHDGGSGIAAAFPSSKYVV